MRAHNRARSIRRNEEGLAYLEFALALPVLLLMLLGGVEVSRYVNINQKLDKTVNTVGDVVAQATSVTTSELDRLMTAVDDMMTPYSVGANGRIVVTSVAAASGNSTVRWQYCGGGTKVVTSNVGAVGANATLPAGFTLSNGEDVVVAEIFYTFTPLFGSRILGTRQVYKRAVFRPRLGALSSYTSSCT